jgi:hypothetical protein
MGDDYLGMANEEMKWANERARLRAENERLREFVDWVDSWVSNPVSGYSVSALDGLFGMTRDRITALQNPVGLDSH